MPNNDADALAWLRTTAESEDTTTAGHARAVLAMVEGLEKEREYSAELVEALANAGVNRGSVNGHVRWWWVARDGSETMCQTAGLAADALWNHWNPAPLPPVLGRRP